MIKQNFMNFYERKINSVIKVKKICIPSGKGLNEQIAQKTQFYCVQFLLKVGVKLNLESGSDLYIQCTIFTNKISLK